MAHGGSCRAGIPLWNTLGLRGGHIQWKNQISAWKRGCLAGTDARGDLQMTYRVRFERIHCWLSYPVQIVYAVSQPYRASGRWPGNMLFPVSIWGDSVSLKLESIFLETHGMYIKENEWSHIHTHTHTSVHVHGIRAPGSLYVLVSYTNLSMRYNFSSIICLHPFRLP